MYQIVSFVVLTFTYKSVQRYGSPGNNIPEKKTNVRYKTTLYSKIYLLQVFY